MSNDTSASPTETHALWPPPAPLDPPRLNYSLGCRPFASASLRAACAHVRENPLCAHGDGDVDYLSFYYCDGTHDASAAASFAAAPHWAKLPILAFWTAALFATVGAVADRFFAPAVERIARKLRLPEDVAGATLLALGGAAPDIFTQAAAIAESATPDLRLAVSESVGAGVFVATVGQALAVFAGLGGARGAAAPVVEVDAFPYVRDALAYGGLIVVTAASVADGKVTTPEAFALVAWYAAYVWAVLRGEDTWRRARGGGRPRGAGGAGGGGGLVGLAGLAGLVGAGRDIEMARNIDAPSETGVFDGAADPRGLAKDPPTGVRGEERERLVRATKTKTSAALGLSGERILAASCRRGGGTRGGSTPARDARGVSRDGGALASLRRWAVTHGGIARDDDASCPGDDDVTADDGPAGPEARARASPDWLAYATAPILLLISLTMVSTRVPGRAARLHLATALALGPAFAAKVTGARAGFEAAAGTSASIAVGALWVAAAFSCVYAYVPRAGVNPRASPALMACTFVVGILWMHACARELVGVFQAAGRIAGVRESLLGATVMAWGASAGDLGGMLAMARAGYVKMAITAALAGPLCQLAMGSGLSMVIVRLRGVPIDSELAPNTKFLLWFGAAFVLGYYGFVVPYVHACAFGRAGAWTAAGTYATACAVFVVWGIASGGED